MNETKALAVEKLLEITALTKVYYQAAAPLVALNGISLEINSGEYLSLVGPSGAGKSTLLHILGGLDSPSGGEVIFKEKNIYRLKDRELSLWRGRHIGFVFQFYHLLEELTVLENVMLASPPAERKSALKTAQDLLKYLGIGKRQEAFPSELSGGEKQKAALARALANDPEIILCDEPTGNLDHDSQEKVVQLLEELNKTRSKTIVLVTHNLELARRAGRTLFLREGCIDKGQF